MYQCDGYQNNEKDKFVKAVDKDIEEGFNYWTVAMNNTALKTLTMEVFTVIKYI